MNDLTADGVIIGLSGILLWHFSNIWRYEQYLAGEFNAIIMSLEMAILVLIYWYWFKQVP